MELAKGKDVFYSRLMPLLSQDELTRLTPPERIALISKLWNSLDNEQLALTEAQRDELDRRLATYEADRREGVTWESLQAELEHRCP